MWPLAGRGIKYMQANVKIVLSFATRMLAVFLNADSRMHIMRSTTPQICGIWNKTYRREATSGKDSSVTTQRQIVIGSHAESLAVGIGVESISGQLRSAQPNLRQIPARSYSPSVRRRTAGLQVCPSLRSLRVPFSAV